MSPATAEDGKDQRLADLLGTALPLIQAPMAGVQGSALCIAVSDAGGLGSLPCAMLSPEALGAELRAIRQATARPYNLNFFCHTPPVPDPAQETAWRRLLQPYFESFGIDPQSIPVGPGRPVRGIVNRLMRELGPISGQVPAFPLATAAISPLWAGQNTRGCREASAAEITADLARGFQD